MLTQDNTEAPVKAAYLAHAVHGDAPVFRRVADNQRFCSKCYPPPEFIEITWEPTEDAVLP